MGSFDNQNLQQDEDLAIEEPDDIDNAAGTFVIQDNVRSELFATLFSMYLIQDKIQKENIEFQSDAEKISYFESNVKDVRGIFVESLSASCVIEIGFAQNEQGLGLQAVLEQSGFLEHMQTMNEQNVSSESAQAADEAEEQAVEELVQHADYAKLLTVYHEYNERFINIALTIAEEGPLAFENFLNTEIAANFAQRLYDCFPCIQTNFMDLTFSPKFKLVFKDFLTQFSTFPLLEDIDDIDDIIESIGPLLFSSNAHQIAANESQTAEPGSGSAPRRAAPALQGH